MCCGHPRVRIKVLYDQLISTALQVAGQSSSQALGILGRRWLSVGVSHHLKAFVEPFEDIILATTFFSLYLITAATPCLTIQELNVLVESIGGSLRLCSCLLTGAEQTTAPVTSSWQWRACKVSRIQVGHPP